MKKKILITGALGQIGSELSVKLRGIYGEDQVIISNSSKKEGSPLCEGLFEIVDVTDAKRLAEVAKKHNVNYIVHLAALLSATGEQKPQLLWDINMNGLYNVLEVCREIGADMFTPSSIAAFGPSTPRDNTPQDTLLRPTTIYGVSKVAGELLCDYYFLKYKVDCRGVRFPGLISHAALPGGGTTDYAVDIYYKALEERKYSCFLKKDTFLPMMYMPDALHAITTLMEADASKLVHRNAFNINAMSLEPEMMAASIRKMIPEFQLSYNIDPIKQGIAESWPNSLDDSAAKAEWGWKPQYDLDAMTKDMLTELSKKGYGKL